MGKKNSKSSKMLRMRTNNVLVQKEYEREKEKINALIELYGVCESVVCFDNTVKKKYNKVFNNLVNLDLLKSIALNSFALPKDFVSTSVSSILDNLTKLGVFANVRPKSNYKNGVVIEVTDEVEKALFKFTPTLIEEFMELYVKTIALIFYYDRDKYNELMNDDVAFGTWCYSVLDICILVVLENHTTYALRELNSTNKTVPKDELYNNFISSDTKEEIETETDELKGILGKRKEYTKINKSFLTGLKSEDFKNCIVEMVNTYYSYISDNSEIPMDTLLEEATDDVQPYSYEKIYENLNFDLSTYIKVSRTNLKKIKYIDCDSLKYLEIYDGVQKALSFVVNRKSQAVSHYYIDPVVNVRVSAYLKAKDIQFSTHKDEKDKEVKDLTTQLRTLKKDFGKLEKSFEEAEKKIQEYEESNKVEIDETQVILDISEVDGYKKQISDLESQVTSDKEDYSKVVNKNNWLENRIKELEDKLKYYDSIENDMMALQNKQNNLLSQIDKIEEMEQEDEDVKKARFEEHLNAIKDLPILFLGGTGNMMSKFMSYFPNSDYIDISDEGVNFTVPQRFAYVVIYTKVVTHSHCARVESMVDKKKIIYVNIFNTELVVDELYKNIIGHKN